MKIKIVVTFGNIIKISEEFYADPSEDKINYFRNTLLQLISILKNGIR